VNKTNKPTPQYPPDALTVEGGNPHLWDELVTANASVEINGTVDGFEVAQLYLGIPNGLIRQLRGFEKVFIASGKSVTVNFTLTRRDLSSWDVKYAAAVDSAGWDLYGLCWSIEPGLAVERYLHLLIDTLCKGDR
jgi:hypothetical protein